MKLKVRYRKDGQIETYSNVTLVGKFPNITEGVRNNGFQVINEDGEPRRVVADAMRLAPREEVGRRRLRQQRNDRPEL